MVSSCSHWTWCECGYNWPTPLHFQALYPITYIFTSAASHFAFPICTNQKKSLHNHHHPVALIRIPTWLADLKPPWPTSYSATTNIMITIFTPGCRWSTSYSSSTSWPSSTSWSQSSHQVALFRSRTWFGTAPPPPVQDARCISSSAHPCSASFAVVVVNDINVVIIIKITIIIRAPPPPHTTRALH